MNTIVGILIFKIKPEMFFMFEEDYRSDGILIYRESKTL